MFTKVVPIVMIFKPSLALPYCLMQITDCCGSHSEVATLQLWPLSKSFTAALRRSLNRVYKFVTSRATEQTCAALLSHLTLHVRVCCIRLRRRELCKARSTVVC